MSTPTFDGTSLTTRAEKQELLPPQTRTFMGTIIGVEGVYTQDNPLGAKPIRVSGLLSATGNTGALALSTLFGVIETMQDKQGDIADYVGTGAQTYNGCELQSYRHGPIETGPTPGAATYTSVCSVEAILIHTVPSNVS